MTAPATARGRDLRALAAIVSQDRPDLPDGEGLPPSLLADLKDQIRCDDISLRPAATAGSKGIRSCSRSGSKPRRTQAFEYLDPARWEHWSGLPLGVPASLIPSSTGDLRSVVNTL